MRTFLTGVGLFASATLVRVLPVASVLSPDRVHFHGPDAYLHLGRIRYALENFPSLLGMDPYTAFPGGSAPPWPPLFDAVFALLLAPFAAVGGPAALELAAAWVPPLLGAAAVVAAWLLARRYFGERVALCAAAFLAVLGGHFSATQLGAFGASAAMSLATTALLAATMAALDSDARKPAVALALAAALVLLLRPEGVLYAAAALSALSLHTLLPGPTRRRERLPRLAFAVGVFAAASAVGFGLLPWSWSLAQAWRGIAGGAGNDFPGAGLESLPLFVLGGFFDGRVASRALSYLVYVYPLVWALMLRESLAAERRGALFFFVFWSALLFAATIFQRRFVDVFAVAFAIGCAWGIGASLGRLRVRGSDASGLVGLAILVLLLPLRSNYVPHLRNLIGRAKGGSLELSRAARIDRLRLGVALWLEAATPPTPGWMGGPGEPGYGVFAPPEAGPVIRYVGRRPTAVDGFGASGESELGGPFWSGPLARANSLLEERRVRYVVTRSGDLRSAAYPKNSVYRTLVQRDGSAGPPGVPAPAARRFRLMYESARLRPGAQQPPLYRIFEFVPGASIEGRAAPGSGIELSLDLLSHGVRELSYTDRTRADARGRFRFVVPYANRGEPGRVKPTGPYTVSCGVESVRVVVRERQVRRGEAVAAPDLCRRARPGAGAPGSGPGL